MLCYCQQQCRPICKKPYRYPITNIIHEIYLLLLEFLFRKSLFLNQQLVLATNSVLWNQVSTLQNSLLVVLIDVRKPWGRNETDSCRQASHKTCRTTSLCFLLHLSLWANLASIRVQPKPRGSIGSRRSRLFIQNHISYWK